MTDAQPAAGVEYRPAAERDRDGVVAVFLACWQRSYRHVLPEGVIAAMTGRRARELWTPLVHDEPGGALVASDGDRVVGVTRWTIDASTQSGSIGSLYVDPGAQGSGIGAELIERAVAAIASVGAGHATLWVFEPNSTARRFYARHGFRSDGTTRVEPEYGVPELRLARPLEPTG